MFIFLYGPDTFRSREKLTELKKKFISTVDKSALNLETLDGVKLDLNKFRGAVLAEAFLAKKRMVVVENIFLKPLKKNSHEVLKTLSEIKNENIIVFWDGDVGAKKLKDSSAVLFAKLEKERYSQKFDLLNEAQLRKWVNSKIKTEKGEIDIIAVNMLVNWVGDDLWQMNSEIDKLLAYCKNRKIDAQAVEMMTKNKLEENIFELTDALGQKNKARALKLISDQLESGTPETVLLSKITWQFKNLLQVKSLADNEPANASYKIAKELGLHPFVVKKSLGQVRNFSLDELKKIYRQLLAIDFSIKTSATSAKTLFDLLVAKY
ncbi:DNA polymerase III subunit delta [Patescibacteria group bacterium]|nr:DNA polymerase III subunit delta [Patescibacteria group bacterium]